MWTTGGNRMSACLFSGTDRKLLTCPLGTPVWSNKVTNTGGPTACSSLESRNHRPDEEGDQVLRAKVWSVRRWIHQSGYRKYEQEDVVRLEIIQTMRMLEMPIAEIGRLRSG